jgi:predicted transcriptional regulator
MREEKEDMKNIKPARTQIHELFETISRPLRIKVLKSLTKTPMSFSELKRVVNVESSGVLDFHLKKTQSLITTDSAGRYTLSTEGHVALKAVLLLSSMDGRDAHIY